MKRQGFTIVELIVIIAVMGILLVLGVVNLTGSQISARDSERKTDIETIATHLETYYTSGSDVSADVGTYPSTTLMTGISAQESALRDVDPKNLVAPGAPSSAVSSLVVATNNVQTTAGVTPLPQSSSSQNQYVYQPLKQDGTLCTSGLLCQTFNLYYMTEADSVVHMVSSRNQ